MSVVRFHRLARAELRSAYVWYRRRSPQAASRFLAAIEDATTRVRQDADSLPAEGNVFRAARVSRFPYRLVFERGESNEIVIIAVAHTSRRPRYWARRK